MNRKTIIALGLLAGLLALWAAPAMAVDVYLNGKKVTGTQDVDFGKVKVKLDKAGNVFIDAPDFKVQEVGPGANAKPNPTATQKAPNPAGLSKQYFIVTEGSQPGGSGYDVKLMINNQYIKTLSDSIPQNVVELNEFLKKGANSISFLAKREGRTAKTAGDTFTLMIGVGDAKGGQLSIEEVLHEYKLTGADPLEMAKTFNILTK